MPRHDYKFRPEPRWENGYFVPSVPQPVQAHPDGWSLFEGLRNIGAMSKNPITASTQVTRTEPYVFTHMYRQSLLVPCSPALIKYIFVENGENYGLNSIRQLILKPILKNGLLTAEGPVWRRARRALSPLFTPRSTENFAPQMKNAVEAYLPRLFEGKNTADFSDAMLRLTYMVLSDTLFSGEIAGESESVLRDVSTFLSALGRVDPLDIIGLPNFIPRPTKLRGFAAIKRLRDRVTELAKDRRARIDQGQAVPDDFLTLLLNTRDEQGALSDAEIEDHIITFIGAGHETTSRALGWMAYLLSQDTQARSRLEAEIDALDMTRPAKDWADHLPWAMACFEESMRLFPPAPIISRFARKADKFEDADIPKDCNILVNLWTLHRHEKLWDRPDSFDPARFYGQARSAIDRFQYLPFGMGRRVCIGQKFALQEAAILIALIFKSYRFDYNAPEPPWPLMRITLQPEQGMPMRVHAR
jgi:cytochrome P450